MGDGVAEMGILWFLLRRIWYCHFLLLFLFCQHAFAGGLSGTLQDSLSRDLALSGTLSPTALSGNTNNYNPTGCSTAFALRIDGGSSNRNLTGLQCADSAPADGRVLMLTNIGTTNTLVLVNQSTSSTTTNRFLLPSDVTLHPNTTITLRYDSSTLRWRLWVPPPPFANIVDVRAYGAKGDGATDDAAAIQAAIDAMPASGGNIHFPAATYCINSTLLIQNKRGLNLTGIRGFGGNLSPNTGSELKWCGAVNGTLLHLNGVARSSFENLSLNGNFLSAGKCLWIENDGLATVGTGNLSFTNMLVHHCQTGIQEGAAGTNQSNNSEVYWYTPEIRNNTIGVNCLSDQGSRWIYYGLQLASNTTGFQTGEGDTNDRCGFAIFGGSGGSNTTTFNLPSLTSAPTEINYFNCEMSSIANAICVKSVPLVSSAGGTALILRNVTMTGSGAGAKGITFEQSISLEVYDSQIGTVPNPLAVEVGNISANVNTEPHRLFVNTIIPAGITKLDTTLPYRIIQISRPTINEANSNVEIFRLDSPTATLYRLDRTGTITTGIWAGTAISAQFQWSGGTSNGNLSGTGVQFFAISGHVGPTGAEGPSQSVVAQANTLSNFTCKLLTAPGAGGSSKQYALVLMKNTSVSAIGACTVVETATTCTGSGTETVVAGDLVDVRATPTSTPAASGATCAVSLN